MSDKYLNLTGLGTLWAKIKTALAGKQDDLSAVLPTDASATNQLATKAYADAIGERLEARYLGSAADGSPFATHAALTASTAYYYQGTATTPDTNDITTVTADEDHIGTTGEASTTRYRWNGTGWAFEYVVNNTGLSEAQLMAVNSGITAAKVSGYDGLSGKISDEASARQTADNAKLNIDGTNATSTGIGTALSKIDIENGAFTDADYFVVRDKDATASTWRKKYASTLWTYIKGKFGGVGDYQTPVYFSDGVPVACSGIQATEIPSTTVSSNGANCYGIFLGGATGVARTTRVNVSFIFSACATGEGSLDVYLGAFAFRGTKGLIELELKSLNGTPTRPWKIWYAGTKNSDGTYDVGLWIVPAEKTWTYVTTKLTKLHASSFDWAPAAADETAYDTLIQYARPPLRPITLAYSSGGSNVTSTGGTWTSTYNKGTAIAARGIVDLTVMVSLSVINQKTYVNTMTSYTVTLVNSAGTEIIPSSLEQTAQMPKAPNVSTANAGTLSTHSTHRFVFPITDSNNLLAGYRVQVQLPSNYTIDSQVNVSVCCAGMILPYDISY
jgi:hypothetical protein